MEENTGTQKTLGQAIDEVVRALESLDDANRVTAIRAACEYLKVVFLTSEKPAAPVMQPPPPPAGPVIAQDGRVVDIKSLKEEKEPSSASEMAALVAFYLAEHAPQAERRSEVNVEDVLKYFKQAGYRLPKARAMLLPNAKNAGYFDSLGDGRYRLNPVGYNLVAHNLPRSRTESPPPRPRRARRTVSTKPKRRQ